VGQDGDPKALAVEDGDPRAVMGQDGDPMFLEDDAEDFDYELRRATGQPEADEEAQEELVQVLGASYARDRGGSSGPPGGDALKKPEEVARSGSGGGTTGLPFNEALTLALAIGEREAMRRASGAPAETAPASPPDAWRAPELPPGQLPVWWHAPFFDHTSFGVEALELLTGMVR
jgi:hypothetical protein